MGIRKFKIKIEGKTFEAEVEEIGSSTKTKTPEQNPVLSTVSVPFSSSGNSVKSPMPGKILKIIVSKGKKIKKGDVVLILEAMKMEQEIKTEIDGTVSDITVSEGDTVKKEQILITLS